MAVAEASFKISIEAISSGEISFRLSKGKPSTIIKGLFPPATETLPRITILEFPPGRASPRFTCTPAARPLNNSETFVVGSLLASSTSTLTTDPITLLFFWLPYPTMITSSKDSASSTKTMLILS